MKITLECCDKCGNPKDREYNLLREIVTDAARSCLSSARREEMSALLIKHLDRMVMPKDHPLQKQIKPMNNDNDYAQTPWDEYDDLSFDEWAEAMEDDMVCNDPTIPQVTDEYDYL